MRLRLGAVCPPWEAAWRPVTAELLGEITDLLADALVRDLQDHSAAGALTDRSNPQGDQSDPQVPA